MTDTTPRERIGVGVRLDADELARIEALATTETEGNRSQMLRKLVAEALERRRATVTRGSEPTFRAAARMVDLDLEKVVGVSVMQNSDLDACGRQHRVEARNIAEDVLAHLLNCEWIPPSEVGV